MFKCYSTFAGKVDLSMVELIWKGSAINRATCLVCCLFGIKTIPFWKPEGHVNNKMPKKNTLDYYDSFWPPKPHQGAPLLHFIFKMSVSLIMQIKVRCIKVAFFSTLIGH